MGKVRTWSVEDIMGFDSDDGQRFVDLEDILKILNEELDYYGEDNEEGNIIQVIIDRILIG